MTKQEYLQRIAALTEQIDALPRGYLSQKDVGGRVYFYHQWSENGSKKSRYLKGEEMAVLSEQIERRKQLQAALKEAKTELAGLSKRPVSARVRGVLMHRTLSVAELELDGNTGFIQKIRAVYTPEHLPLGVKTKNGMADRRALNAWWVERSIPAGRSGVREALETLELADTRALLIRCYGLSLSDQYWFCPEGSGLRWQDINFFEHEFSEDIGDVLFGANRAAGALDFSSPDNTSDGNLKKRWKIIDGRRCLIKGGSNPYRQQPFNEVIATQIMARLGIPCVPYTLLWYKGAPYSVCEDFVDDSTELVPAWRIIQTQKQPNNRSLYQHFVVCAETLGIPGVVPFLDRMIVLDYLLLNEDRHLNNFGALRRAETLEWLGMAPVYDSGSSLGYDKTVPLMRNPDEVVCKPFKKRHEEQLELVSSFDWIDFSALRDVSAVIRRVLSDERAVEYVDDRRVRVICELTEQRIRVLESLACSPGARRDAIEDDVTENIAAAYS